MGVIPRPKPCCLPIHTPISPSRGKARMGVILRIPNHPKSATANSVPANIVVET